MADRKSQLVGLPWRGKLRSSSSSKPESNGDEQPGDGKQQQTSTSNSNARLDDPEVRFEEKLRKKVFSHYDCQSMTASLNIASKLCHVLSKRRNTTTGASAASMLSKNNSDEEIDEGDGRSNDLVLSCPYFRNELGGEEERTIALNRTTYDRPSVHLTSPSSQLFLHKPNMACGLALLEDANERRWKLKSCPYQKLTNEKSFIIENYDIGATYYREHFYGLEHQNWFGIDDNLGPVAFTIRKERIGALPSESNHVNHSSTSSSATTQIKHQYRVIVRTSELTVLRGTVHEDCIPSLSSSSRHNHHNNHHAKEVLEYIAPEISLSCLRLGVSNADEQLLKLDEQVLTRTYKVGVLYCNEGQHTEEEMYNNEHAGPAFEDFISCLGEKVRLKGFDKYRAGLDNKTDTTGLHSIYTTYNDCEIQFHVSTLLPYTPNNRQQLLRKRHIGNDIITIVFQEPGAKPFTPKTIRSHFQHVFIIVRLLPSNGGVTRYAVGISRSKEVPVFGPPISEKGIYTKSKAFTEFLLSKIINAENAAHRSEKFRSMAQRTRHEYLKDLAQNYVQNTTINDLSSGSSAGAKLVSTIFGSSKKSRAGRNRDAQFMGNSAIKGAIVWEMSVEDYGHARIVDCLVGISSDTLVIIEETTKEVIFVCPNSSILGWTSHPSSIKIFFHQGECILLKCKDPDLDEITEIVSRLKAVTQGCETQEIILRRNCHFQLGFHVGHEGIVTEVERYAYASQAGLRQNFRIVEICKVAIATLDHEQIIDLLKTSITVTVTVLPPLLDGSPRRGCNLQNCSYLTALSTGTGDYENISGMLDRRTPVESRSRSHTPNKMPMYPTVAHSGGAKNVQHQPVAQQQAERAGRGLVAVTTSSIYSLISPMKKAVINRKQSGHMQLGRENEHMSKQLANQVSRSELSLANKSLSPHNSNSLTRDIPATAPLHHHSHSRANRGFVAAQPSSIYSNVSQSSSLTANVMPYNMAPTKKAMVTRKHSGKITSAREHEVMSRHIGNLVSWRSELSLTNEPFSSNGFLSREMPHDPPILHPRASRGIYPVTTSASFSAHNQANFGSVSLNSSPYNSLTPAKKAVLTKKYSGQISPLCRENSGATHPRFGNGLVTSLSELSLNKTFSSPSSTLSRDAPSQQQPYPLTHSRSHSQHLIKLNEVTSLSTMNGFDSNNDCNAVRAIPVGITKPTSDYHSDTSSNDCASNVWSLPHMPPNAYASEYLANGNSVQSLNQSNKEKERIKRESLYNRTKCPKMLNQHNLRSGVNERIRVKNGSSKSSGSSCSGSSSSTLQEDLLKLINPEYLSDTVDCEASSSSGAETSTTQYSTPYSSLERSGKDGDDVILTVAQPAQVITSEPSSPSEFEKQKVVVAPLARSPISMSSINSPPPSFEPNSLPVLTESDSDTNWSNIVDSATKAMVLAQSGDKQRSSAAATLEESLAWLSEFGANLPGNHQQLPSESVKELENRVKKLQVDLVREQSEKATLEEENKNLRERNQHLLEESQTAAAQLRKFTEWFFQNINAK